MQQLFVTRAVRWTGTGEVFQPKPRRVKPSVKQSRADQVVAGLPTSLLARPHLPKDIVSIEWRILASDGNKSGSWLTLALTGPL